MFNQIKTSSQNKDAVTILTRKFGLGAENVIVRGLSIFRLIQSEFYQTSNQIQQGWDCP